MKMLQEPKVMPIAPRVDTPIVPKASIKLVSHAPKNEFLGTDLAHLIRDESKSVFKATLALISVGALMASLFTLPTHKSINPPVISEKIFLQPQRILPSERVEKKTQQQARQKLRKHPSALDVLDEIEKVIGPEVFRSDRLSPRLAQALGIKNT